MTNQMNAAPNTSPWDMPATNASAEHFPTSRMSKRGKIVGVLVAIILLIGAIFGVYEVTDSSSKHAAVQLSPGTNGAGIGGGATFGTVKAINGTTLTLSSTSGNTTTVNTTSSTKYFKTSSGTASELTIGDNVSVMSSDAASSGSTSAVAARITDSGTTSASMLGAGHAGGPGNNGAGGMGAPPNGSTPSGSGLNAGASNGSGPGANGGSNDGHAMGPSGGIGDVVSGTIKSINGSTVAINETDGTTAVFTTNSSTTYEVVSSIDSSAIVVGDTVMVQGSTSNGTLAATEINDGADGFGGDDGGAPLSPRS
jgi:hypothetical protein